MGVESSKTNYSFTKEKQHCTDVSLSAHSDQKRQWKMASPIEFHVSLEFIILLSGHMGWMVEMTTVVMLTICDCDYAQICSWTSDTCGFVSVNTENHEHHEVGHCVYLSVF